MSLLFMVFFTYPRFSQSRYSTSVVSHTDRSKTGDLSFPIDLYGIFTHKSLSLMLSVSLTSPTCLVLRPTSPGSGFFLLRLYSD